MKKEIHIWDLEKMEANIVVDLSDNLKDKIGFEIKSDIYRIANEFGIQPSRLFEYFIWKKSLIPLTVLSKISKKFNISKKKIEKSIIIYKQLHVPSKNSIKHPKFPIIVDPCFTSIISNLFFDGSVPRDGRGTYYNQKNEEIIINFINRLKKVFGEVSYSLRLDHRGVLKCRIPRIIGEICKFIYNVNSFGSFDSRIPKKIFDMGSNHRIAFIIAAILDEGSITYDGQIQFGVSNKNMMMDFANICKMVGLQTTKIKEGKSGRYHLYIKPIEKFYKIYSDFIKKHTLISLNYKAERLEKSLEIKKQKFSYTKDFSDKRRNLILGELIKGGLTVNFLASKLLIPPKTVRRYTNRLVSEGKVNKKKTGHEYTYFLDH